MSQDQLVEAYVKGEISRRIFIRRLIAIGLALPSALAYADLLSPEARAAPRASDHYEHYEERSTPRKARRRKVRRRRRFRRRRRRRGD